jgi:hypothetical protein
VVATTNSNHYSILNNGYLDTEVKGQFDVETNMGSAPSGEADGSVDPGGVVPQQPLVRSRAAL